VIDARAATGVPCITPCPVVLPRSFLVVAGVKLDAWQERLLRAHGFVVADGNG
jgi:hypothetical protein